MPPKRRQSHRSPMADESPRPSGGKRTRVGPSRGAILVEATDPVHTIAPEFETVPVPEPEPGPESESAPTIPAEVPKASLLATQDNKPAISASTYRSPFLVASTRTTAMLADAMDLEDYKTQLHYFWGHIFLIFRNLKAKERQELFMATLPDFDQEGEIRSQLEKEFDKCYRKFQQRFIQNVESYGQRWLRSAACQRFLEVDLHARKQKRPRQYPIPEPPKTGQDLLQFQDQEGLEWNYKTAIDFWSYCLPAFETCIAPENHIGWFLTEEETADVAFKELSGVALELIRQFAVFEMRSPCGYSLEAHTHALRAIMPGILNQRRFDPYELPVKLGLVAVVLPEIAAMPKYDLVPWVPIEMRFGNETDETKADIDALEVDNQNEALFNEMLSEVDNNIRRVDEGLPASDDVTARDYESAAQLVKQVEGDITRTFNETLEESLNADDTYIVTSEHHPAMETLAVPELHAPLILQGPLATRRAEIYASGNIWARQLMGQTDRSLALRRLNALLVAAKHAINLLRAEEEKQHSDIVQLEEGNKYLCETWKEVQERIDRNKALEVRKDRLKTEYDSLQSHMAMDQEGQAGSGPTFGFSGLRFRDTGSPITTGFGLGSGLISSRLTDSINSRSAFAPTRPTTPAIGSSVASNYFHSQPILGHEPRHPQPTRPAGGVAAAVSRDQRPVSTRPAPSGNRSNHIGQSGHQGYRQATNRPTSEWTPDTRDTTTPGNYLSQLGHHEYRSGNRSEWGSVTDTRDTAAGSGIKASAGSRVERLTRFVSSPPRTPLSTLNESPYSTPRNTSSFALERGLSDGLDDKVNRSSTQNPPTQFDARQDLLHDNPAIDLDSDLLDDSSLLQATASAEREQEEQSHLQEI